jgi:Uma2 family endonuclease
MNAPSRPPATFTTAEFQRLVRSGGLGDMRVELRRGMICKMSPQYVPHARVKMHLTHALDAALKAAGLGWEVWNEVSVAFGDGFEPLPDIVVWNPAEAPSDLDGPIPAAAVKLIVEVSDSSLADDLGEKLEDYAGGGLAEYWVADIKGKLILRHAGPQAGGYARREPLRFGEPASLLTHAAIIIDTSALA